MEFLTALHIGDHIKADVLIPRKYGIESYHVPSAWELFGISPLGIIRSKICTEYASVTVGLVLGRLYADPYYYKDNEAKIKISNEEDMGYIVFGPVILTFLLWILKVEKRYVFMARDGYFLEQDFEFLCKKLNVFKKSCYIGISRQLAMMAAIESKKDLLDFLEMPYTGTITQLFQDRLGIDNVEEHDSWILQDYISHYEKDIAQRITTVKNNYRNYLETFDLSDNDVIIDLGYYGNNQRYLNKLLGLSMEGLYFNANLSEKNKNITYQKMQGCFQGENDYIGEHSNILKKMIYIESLLTAPYGMVKEIKKDGTFLCDEKKKNQEYFFMKEKINEGVKLFISDYIEKFGNGIYKLDCNFIDKYYGICMNGAVEFSEHIKKSFWNDNAMMNRIESPLFY